MVWTKVALDATILQLQQLIYLPERVGISVFGNNVVRTIHSVVHPIRFLRFLFKVAMDGTLIDTNLIA